MFFCHFQCALLQIISSDSRTVMRVGVLGYGHLGQYLVKYILDEGKKHDLQLDFVWNRSADKLKDFREDLVLKEIADVKSRCVDLIVEVAHPALIQDFGVLLLSVANIFIGSPTALADIECEKKLKQACNTYNRTVYVPSGAFWGAQDIQKMSNLNSLSSLKVTMKKHPSAFRLLGDLKKANDDILRSSSTKPLVLYDGPVRELCALAPNNVNTMAAAAVAAHNLGFDKVVGQLVSDPSLTDWHIVEVEVRGKPTSNGLSFETLTTRKNPANPGVVTGSATYGSFCNSLLQAKYQRSCGFHLC